MSEVWRVGRRIRQNLYKGDVPVAMCQTPELAAEISAQMNKPASKWLETIAYVVAEAGYGNELANDIAAGHLNPQEIIDQVSKIEEYRMEALRPKEHV